VGFVGLLDMDAGGCIFKLMARQRDPGGRITVFNIISLMGGYGGGVAGGVGWDENRLAGGGIGWHYGMDFGFVAGTVNRGLWRDGAGAGTEWAGNGCFAGAAAAGACSGAPDCDDPGAAGGAEGGTGEGIAGDAAG